MKSLFHSISIKKRTNGFEVAGLPFCKLGNKINNERQSNTDGVFAEWSWDGNRLTIHNDYSGYYPLFYHADSNQIMASNSILKLIALGAPADFDEDALAVFCRCGFFVGERTPFRQISMLPPDGKLQWQGGHLSVEGKKRITRPQKLSSKDAVDGYIEFFRRAMERYLPSNKNFALPLSGGRDSRQILLELCRRGALPTICITCGEERDVILAKKLTDRLNLKHRTLIPDQLWMDYVWRKNISTHLCALEHTWMIRLGDYLAANFQESYEGTGVGALTRGDLFTRETVDLYETGHFNDIAAWTFFRYGPPEEFFKLLPVQFSFIAENRDISIKLFANELQSLSEAANPLTAMSFWNWGRRAIALHPFGIQSRVRQVNTPFLDRDLYDFVSSLTPEIIFEQEPQAEAIKKAFPEFADVLFYNELPKQKAGRRPLIRRCRNTLKKLLVVAKCSPSLMPVIWQAYSLKKHGSFKERNAAIQETVLLYLSQLSYCSDKTRAEKVLNEYTAVCACLNNIYRDKNLEVMSSSN